MAAVMSQSTNHSNDSNTASAMASRGGAWEAVVDRAVSQVTEYLATSATEFDPSALLSTHMLRLLDRGTVRDLLVERNYNALCGCFGCGNKPRGLLYDGVGTVGGLSFDWPSSSDVDGTSSCCSSEEGEEAKHIKNECDRGGKSCSRKGSLIGAETAERDPNGEKSDGVTYDEDKEEIVYEDDIYTAESFRLVQRQRAMLHRMQRKKDRRAQKAERAAANHSADVDGRGSTAHASAVTGAAVAGPRLRRSGLLGANFPQRFCTPECEELYESGILRAVTPFRSIDFATLFAAITNLFPNLSVSTLQQLAGAEVSAAWLVRPVTERGSEKDETSSASPPPLQVGQSFESTLHSTPSPKAAASSGTGNAHKVRFADGAVNIKEPANTDAMMNMTDAEGPLLRHVLEEMHVLQRVWSHEVVPRFSATHLPRIAPASASNNGDGGRRKAGATKMLNAQGVALSSVGRSMTSVSSSLRPALRGSLLIFDFLMSASGVTTRRLFALHYARHRAALQTALACAGASANGNAFFLSVSTEVITAMEKSRAAVMKKAEDQAASDPVSPSAEGKEVEEEEEALHTDPVLQQQRRQLFTKHIFSEDVAATLSRLLLFDYALLLGAAWAGVWMVDLPLTMHDHHHRSSSEAAPETHKVGCSLLRSLRFPFTVPALLLQPPATTPEVLGLAMCFLLAAGCCSAEVWQGCMTEEAAFEEVAEVVGLTKADVTAAVISLLLGDEQA